MNYQDAVRNTTTGFNLILSAMPYPKEKIRIGILFQ